MLKKRALRKILITSLTIVILLMIYIMPKSSVQTLDVKPTIEYSSNQVGYVYMLNDNNFLVKVNVLLGSFDNVQTEAKEILNKLIIGDSSIPKGLRNIIPKDVKILDVQFDNGYLSINFSKEILNVEESLQEKLVEAVAYSLFEIKKINKIGLYVNEEELSTYFKKVNNTSEITRDFGINKEYNIKSLKNIQKVVIYYISEIDNNKYMVPVTNYINDNEEKIKIIIESLSSRYIYQPNLKSLLNTNTELINYEINDDIMLLNFNNSIFMKGDNILEEVVYTISNSVFDNYDVNKVILNVDNRTIKEISKY